MVLRKPPKPCFFQLLLLLDCFFLRGFFLDCSFLRSRRSFRICNAGDKRYFAESGPF
jgi:hypothetical protein